MGVHHQRRFWRLCRIYFRRLRISVWLVILALLGAVVYVNHIGLPDFVKRPLLEKLRERGLDLQFSRLRVRWYQGIVAENVHFGPADQESSPQLNVAEVQVRLNWDSLAHLQLQVDSLMLRQGHVSWALSQPGNSLQALSIDKIQTDLRFLPGDQWSLDNFKAQFAGANIQLSGAVTNASAVREWKIFQGEQPASRSAQLWHQRLLNIANTLERIHFSAPPELRVNVRGDARDLYTFNVLLSLSAPGADTPWGTVSSGRFAARLFSVDTNGLSRAELDLHAGDAQTPWAAITNFSLIMRLTSVDTETNLVKGELKLSAAQAQTQWAGGSNAVFTATWTHSITNPIPVSGQGRITCDFAQSSWASARDIQLQGSLRTAAESNNPAGRSESWAWWTNLEPYQLSWDCQFADLKSPKLVADRIACSGDWHPPRLTVTNLQASLFQGHLSAQAGVDVATRDARLAFDSDLDPRRLAQYLPQSAEDWLQQVDWPQAPRVRVEVAFVAPAWTNREPDWRTEVQPTLRLNGQFHFDRGATFRQVQTTALHGHILYSNQVWRVPDLTLTRPEGALSAEQSADERTGEFSLHVRSAIDPFALRPLLDESTGQVLQLFNFSQPPTLEFDVWGRGAAPDRLGLSGHVAITNFSFRGENLARLDTRIEYTNRQVRILAPRVDTVSGYVTADGLTVDLDRQLAYLTNGFSTAEPMLVARAIGPNIVHAIEDYRFDSPPTARVYGTIPLQGEESADLHFDLDGGPFHWWKFNLPHLTGHVHWAGLHLTITNIQAEFYHGTALGWAAFDFPPTPGTDFQFTMNVTNVLLESLMSDLSTHTNHLEGRLHGSLVVTRANSESWQTVFGYGDVHLRDGLLWDIPVFGIFSPMLNGLVPGLGNSRASAATATFVITNGFIRSTDMDIRSTGMRLQYRGTVNLESQVKARVDAELLRDMWLVGPLVSTMFWPVTKLFEYKVSGNLDDPKTEPVFILPKIMLLPFHPVRTLKGLIPEDPNTSPNFSPLPP